MVDLIKDFGKMIISMEKVFKLGRMELHIKVNIFKELNRAMEFLNGLMVQNI